MPTMICTVCHGDMMWETLPDGRDQELTCILCGEVTVSRRLGPGTKTPKTPVPDAAPVSANAAPNRADAIDNLTNAAPTPTSGSTFTPTNVVQKTEPSWEDGAEAEFHDILYQIAQVEVLKERARMLQRVLLLAGRPVELPWRSADGATCVNCGEPFVNGSQYKASPDGPVHRYGCRALGWKPKREEKRIKANGFTQHEPSPAQLAQREKWMRSASDKFTQRGHRNGIGHTE